MLFAHPQYPIFVDLLPLFRTLALCVFMWVVWCISRKVYLRCTEGLLAYPGTVKVFAEPCDLAKYSFLKRSFNAGLRLRLWWLARRFGHAYEENADLVFVKEISESFLEILCGSLDGTAPSFTVKAWRIRFLQSLDQNYPESPFNLRVASSLGAGLSRHEFTLLYWVHHQQVSSLMKNELQILDDLFQRRCTPFELELDESQF